jgi:hypothetical protein
MARDDSPSPGGIDQYFQKSDVARDLGKILGLDLTHTSTQMLQKALQAIPQAATSLSMETEKRYTEVCISDSPFNILLMLCRSEVNPPPRYPH